MEFLDLNGNPVKVYRNKLDDSIRQAEYFTTLRYLSPKKHLR